MYKAMHRKMLIMKSLSCTLFSSHFFIDSFAFQFKFNRRVSVIRGQVVSKEHNGLIGIRVSVSTDPQFGFTLTRSDGWYETAKRKWLIDCHFIYLLGLIF